MKKLLNFYSILFFLIIIVALFFRFALLSSVPPAGSLDEVSIGWNAYSILLTGKGEYGRMFPIIMQAYDDFRPAGYLYMVIPFIKIFGLTELAVRFPSAILSIVMVVGSFFLAKIFFKGYRYEKWMSLLTMGLFAISPFHIYISRLGHEVNPGLTFAFLGILFFLWGILSPKKWLLIIAGIFWAASFYTYQSEKIFVPLIVTTLLILFFKKVWKNKKMVIGSLLLTFFLSLPIFYASLQPGALVRLKGTSVFSDPHPFIEASLKLAQAKNEHNLIGEIIYNRRFIPVYVFVGNYIPHFSPEWWIGNSGREQFKAPGFGLSYTWELPLFIFGLFFLWLLPIAKPLKILPILWIVIAFVAPGITTQTPHAMRSYNILPIPQLIEAIGFVGLFIALRKITAYGKIFQKVFVGLLVLFVVLSIKNFSYAYFVDFPQKESGQYQYALHNAIQYVIAHKNQYSQFVVSNQNQATQSYMFYLFESKYSPILYQQHGGTKSGGFAESHHIDNITFTSIDSIKNVQPETLYIGNVEEIPDNVGVVEKFRGLANKVRLVAFTKK